MFDFISHLPISLRSKNLVCHSDLTIFGRDIVKYKNKFIAELLKSSGLNNIFIPTFNLDTKSETVINLALAPLAMGALASEAITLCQSGLAIRTPNPIHSYVAVAKDDFIIPDCRHDLSFGERSIFEYFIANEFIWLSLGASPNTGFTIFHHLEALASVPYRKWINFERLLIHNDKSHKITYHYYARQSSELIQNFEPAVEYLIKKKCLFQLSIGERNIFIGESRKIAMLILDKLSSDPYFLVKKNS